MSKEIEITAKQAEYIRNAHHRWNFSIGAVRSGKSHIAVQYVIPQCLLERAGKKGLNLILGATKENIERNVLQPMRDIWGDSCISGISSRNIATIFGEKVYCIGAANVGQVSRLRGSEIKFCYCDEIVDVNENVFDMLKSRLSLPYSVCHAAANPSYPGHYIKKFIDSADQGIDIYCQKYTLFDNPFLPAGYVEALQAEYAGTVYYQRYILGEWTQAEGLIYPMYTKAMAKPSEKDNPTDTVVSIDYGTQNAFAALLWQKYGSVWYCVKCYYYSGRAENRQKTDAEYGDDLDEWIADALKQRREYTDPDTEFGKIKVIIDPSAASFIALMKKKRWCKVIPADNDVSNGIRETATALQTELVKLSPDLKPVKQEIEGYVWADGGEDRPVKENDHAMDALRYFVKTMKIVKQREKYRPLWN